MIEAFSFSFSQSRQARAAILRAEDDPDDIAQALGLRPSRPVLVLIGGAGNLDDATASRLDRLFQEAIAPLAQSLNLLVIDGGTDAGIIRLMGQARQGTNGQFDLLGIAPIGKVQLPQSSWKGVRESALNRDWTQGHELEKNHTHFILVPGQDWGAESAWLARFAELLSGTAPSAVVLINGGSISLVDLQESLKLGHPAVIIAGSGRLADKIADAIYYPNAVHGPELEQLVQQARDQIVLYDLLRPLDDFTALLQQIMAQYHSS